MDGSLLDVQKEQVLDIEAFENVGDIDGYYCSSMKYQFVVHADQCFHDHFHQNLKEKFKNKN